MENEKSEFTPGPWRLGDAGHTVFGPPNGEPAPELIAGPIRNRANARLIRAAPELLAALENMVNDGWEDDEVRKAKARAAIARATEGTK